MKKILLVSSMVGAVWMIASGPATAREFPYCIQGTGVGIPGDCQYRSYRECMATASGRNVYCNINPRFAAERGRRGQRYDSR